MKKVTLCLIVSIFLSVLSCSDDDSSPASTNIEPDASEEVSLDPTEISENISIVNGEKKAGNPPTPNGAIAFSMPTNNQSGFQNNGFDISFNAPASYAGAYIQIKGENGDIAPEYFDVKPGKSSYDNKKRKFFKTSEKLNDNDITIDVDFNENVTAGTFCYIICIYDNQGNISDPVEVCVEVEAWAGNPNLVGTWELYKSEYTYGDETQTEEINVEFCESYSLYCSSTQQQIDVEDGICETLISADLILNADGTYTYNETQTGHIVDYEASNDNNCSPVLVDDNDSYYSKGNWAYDEEEQRFTLVEFEWQEDNWPLEIEENGYLLFDGALELDNSNFVISGEDTFEGITETFKSFFRKKE